MFCIYKISFPNNKVYIGKTNSFVARRNQHLCSARKGENLKVYRAMRKYNTTKDDFTIIEDNIESNEQCCIKEIYWILYYDSYYNGYNSTLGGEAGSGLKGENHPLSKLSEQVVKEIRFLKSLKKYQCYEIRENYSYIPKSTFMKIWDYTTWKHVLPEYNTQEYKNFYRKLRKNMMGENGNKSHFSNKEVYDIRVLYYTTDITFKELYNKFGKNICRTSFQRLLNGKNYPNVEMPEQNEIYRAKSKQPTQDEIDNLVLQFNSGKPLEQLNTGIFRFYTLEGLKALIKRKHR